MNLEILHEAIRDRRCLTALHKGRTRHFAPYALGYTSERVPAAFVFQYGGATSSHLPARGEWRCFHLRDLSDLRPNGDRWRTPPNYSLPRQTCLAEVVLNVPET
jgi:hypothetical protein